jgi:hypothetical protein
VYAKNVILQNTGISAYSTICTSCWIATQEMDSIQKIAEAIRIENNFVANIIVQNKEKAKTTNELHATNLTEAKAPSVEESHVERIPVGN